MYRVPLLILVLILPSQSISSELEDYIAHVREYRMDGAAEITMITAAGICLGHSLLEYKKDPQSGRYWPSYKSLTCPTPEADPTVQAAWEAELGDEREAFLLAVRDVADADKSGFVTREEAAKFRRTVEFGYLVSQIQQDAESTIEDVASAKGITPEDTRVQIGEYQDLRSEILATGIRPTESNAWAWLPEVKPY